MRKLLIIVLTAVLTYSGTAQVKVNTAGFIKSGIAADELILTNNLSADTKLIQENYIQNQVNMREERAKKTPILAALMSAALPGAGQFYAESYWKTAVFLVIEAAAITTNIIYNNKADKATEEYLEFADAHWSAVRYSQWLNQYGSTYGATQTIDINPDPSLPHYSRVDFNQINAVERQISTFSHTLPGYAEQQYFELIGKYYQFNHGWDDSDPNTAEYLNNISPNFYKYADMHIKPDNLSKVSSTAIIVLVTNHILSAFDAAWTTANYNKSVAMNVRVDEIYYGLKKEIYPTFNLQIGL